MSQGVVMQGDLIPQKIGHLPLYFMGFWAGSHWESINNSGMTTFPSWEVLPQLVGRREVVGMFC